MKYIDLIQTNF